MDQKQYNKSRVDLYTRKKTRAMQYLGSKCVDCDFVGPSAAFDFHHIDPSEKDFDWSRMRTWKWETLLLELDKCILLCVRCHRIRHWEENHE